MRSKRINIIIGTALVAIVAIQVMLFLVSWLISAASPDTTVHSLLSSEGIRWFFGTFVDNVASQGLAWVILMAMAYGMISDSHIINYIMTQKDERSYRQTFAMRMVWAMTAVFIVIIVLVAFIPHAPLLSVTGRLFPSSFSLFIIPLAALYFTISAAMYGLLTGSLRNVGDLAAALCKGIAKAAPVILVYVFGVELLRSVEYVFSISGII